MLLVTHDVEEAPYLADRVVVLSNRPARIEDVVQVELPHPRRRDAQQFASLRGRVLDRLGVDHEQRDSPAA